MSSRVGVVIALALLALAACVDLKKGRPYRCEQDGDCAAGWQCLRDNYCHAPDVGADVPCLTTADDCTGGWICGNAKRCLDPAQPSDFPCADDSQCVGGWRCTAAGRCLEYAREPQPSSFVGAGAAVVLSPQREATTWMAVSPPFREQSLEGSTFLGAQVARPRGDSVEVLFFATQLEPNSKTVSNHLVVQQDLRLGFEPQALATTWAMLAAQRPDGGVVLVAEDGGLVDQQLGFVPRRLAPVAWVEPQWAGIGALADDQSVLLFPGGQPSLDLGRDVRDLAPAVLEDGGLAVVVLRARTSTLLSVVELASGKDSPLVVTDGSEGVLNPAQLRVEGERFAVSFEVPGISFGAQEVRLACPECPAQLGPPSRCLESLPLPDFGVWALAPPATPTPVLSCASGELRSGEGAGEVIDVRDGLVTGTSGSHVRQLPTGQLLFAHELGLEVSSVLATRPRALAVWSGALLALADGRFYAQTFTAPDAGAAPGLSLVATTALAEDQIAGFLEGDDQVVAARGYSLGDAVDGGRRVEFFLNSPRELLGNTRARLLATDAGVLLAASEGDSLYAVLRDPDGVAIAEPRLRPAVGFPITDWALRAGEGVFVEGWVVANNRLFRVTASAVERWKSSEVTPPGRDPVGVWFSGESALLGTATGEVLALPSGVPLAPPLGDVLSVDGLCGTVLATTSAGVWRLASARDGGLARWDPVATPELDAPEVVITDGHALVTDANGVVLEVPVTCP